MSSTFLTVASCNNNDYGGGGVTKQQQQKRLRANSANPCPLWKMNFFWYFSVTFWVE